jgi:hypothetical protein
MFLLVPVRLMPYPYHAPRHVFALILYADKGIVVQPLLYTACVIAQLGLEPKALNTALGFKSL